MHLHINRAKKWRKGEKIKGKFKKKKKKKNEDTVRTVGKLFNQIPPGGVAS